MVFKIDFLDDGRVVEWGLTSYGTDSHVVDDYSPRFYVGVNGMGKPASLEQMAELYANHPDVVNTEIVERQPGYRRSPELTLAVDVCHIDRIKPLARLAHHSTEQPIGNLACFNVDFSREFRYCLETGADPTPNQPLSTLRLAVPTHMQSASPYPELTIGEKRATGSPRELLDIVNGAVTAQNPDVLICSTADIIPTLYKMAQEVEYTDFSLSRWPGVEYQELAGSSTYASYGEVGHSPARYNIPGRAIIDESNTFFYDETNLEGVIDLVSRSGKPLQELAWASIGNVLTAMQIQAAQRRGVLTPWHSWRHEFFKPMGTLHDADRGGFIFAPDVGVHENVHELDFASLYPNIICTRNVSPDVIRCDCHSDREDVPELGYSICDERGMLVDVLQPLIDSRSEIKDEIKAEETSKNPDEERLEKLEGRSSALKWILVACFGYQGFSNAKFGRIECHEAINAFAREILLTAKARLEAGGWKVVHGIVDSIWVTPQPDVDEDEREPLPKLAREISEEIGIELEYETAYDWVAFVPQQNSEVGALTKYFGKYAEGDEFKYRGIEARQRSTPEYVGEVQKECITRFDENRDPGAVLEYLARAISKLQRGKVDTKQLVERNRVSKPAEAYTQYTQNVAALERASDRGVKIHPGQDVEYIVTDDDKTSRERVVLAHEKVTAYDADYYEKQLIRAVESVLSPLGFDKGDIDERLSDTTEMSIRAYTD